MNASVVTVECSFLICVDADRAHGALHGAYPGTSTLERVAKRKEGPKRSWIVTQAITIGRSAPCPARLSCCNDAALDPTRAEENTL